MLLRKFNSWEYSIACLKNKRIFQYIPTCLKTPYDFLLNEQSKIETDKLLDFFKRLDKKVTIRISAHKRGEPNQEIGFAP